MKNKSNKRQALQIFGCIIVGTLFCGFIIIYITPLLYPLHPWSDNKFDVTEIPTQRSMDHVYFIRDSVIVCQNFVHADSEINSVAPEVPTMGDLGTFGDSAGFWNAIFSALAMLGVAYTIWYTRNKDSKEEERMRLAQFHEQCITMCNMLSEIVNQLKISNKPIPDISIIDKMRGVWTETQSGNENEQKLNISESNISGRSCFKYVYEERKSSKSVRTVIEDYRRQPNNKPNEYVYAKLREAIGEEFDHYFRFVYRILKFISETDLGGADKIKQLKTRRQCAGLLRAQLSTYELILIYYNGLNPRFREKTQPLYKEFCLFDNLEPDRLAFPEEIEYYKRVMDECKNGTNYNTKIHYSFEAFIKTPEQKVKNSDNKGRKSWFKPIKIKTKRYLIRFQKCKRHNVNAIMKDNSEIENLFFVLRNLKGKPITFKELSRESEIVSSDKLKKMLSQLKADGFIKTKNTNKGNCYLILKDFE